MFNTAKEIKETYTNAFVVDCAKKATSLLREFNTKTYVYIMIADDSIVILGEGTGNRGYLMFPGRAAPAHLKAITAALATHTSSKVERIIIPTDSKEESLEIEKEFHNVSVDQKNKELYNKRLEQLNIENVNSTAMLFLMNATGTDMGTFKKIRSSINAEENKFITEVFGGYYSDI